MIEPILKDNAFLADVAAARTQSEHLHLWWLGQSGFLALWQNQHLLFDPYLSDSLTTKYANTDKQHVRMTARVVDPAWLNFIDVVTSSHNHTDHLDAETLGPLLRVNPTLKLVIPEANRIFVCDRLAKSSSRPIGLDAGQSVTLGAFEIHGVPAAHESIELDERGRCKFMGFVVKAGPWTIYHSGDTVLFEGMVEGLKHFAIDIALLPVNGHAPERRVAGNLDGIEAARLAKEISAGLAIPCHYEMFEFNTASPEIFAAECGRLGQAHKVLRCGERWLGTKHVSH